MAQIDEPDWNWLFELFGVEDEPKSRTLIRSVLFGVLFGLFVCLVVNSLVGFLGTPVVIWLTYLFRRERISLHPNGEKKKPLTEPLFHGISLRNFVFLVGLIVILGLLAEYRLQ